MTVEAPPITNLRPGVPAHVVGALPRALAKGPVSRFSGVAQFTWAFSFRRRALEAYSAYS